VRGRSETIRMRCNMMWERRKTKGERQGNQKKRWTKESWEVE